MKIESYGISNVGMKRNQNEDRYLINEDLGLYIVADGMGGHLGGEFASQLAVTTIEEAIQRLSSPEATHIHGVNSEASSYGERLRFAIQEASSRIYEQALYDESLKGMGTTTVAVLLNTHKAYIAHVGDSRCYFIRENEAKQITEDHSLITEQIKAGVLSQDEAKGHRFKNIITRSVGYQQSVESDLIEKEVQTGDVLLLCSDGLSNFVEPQDMLSILGAYDLPQAADKLVALANQRGGDDNITLILIKVREN